MSGKTLIRLPNWLGDLSMALPLLRTLAQVEPDLVCFGGGQYRQLLQYLGLKLDYRELPPKKPLWAYYRHFYRQRENFLRAILLANSQRADLEAWLLGAKERWGIAWQGRARLLLNRRYRLENFALDPRHQCEIWADFARFCGYENPIDYRPFALNEKRSAQITLIAGSANNPKKRWSPENYRALVAKIASKFPDFALVLAGSPQDFAICEQISSASSAQNLAGKTDLVSFVQMLAKSALVIGNDTGGIHLANCVGTPVIALFGPTNAEKTKPHFAAPLSIIRPPNCPATGGGNIEDISVEMVFRAVEEQLAAGCLK